MKPIIQLHQYKNIDDNKPAQKYHSKLRELTEMRFSLNSLKDRTRFAPIISMNLIQRPSEIIQSISTVKSTISAFPLHPELTATI